MKKTVFLLLVLLLAGMCAVCAAEDVTVWFPAASGAVNTGFSYALEIRSNAAPETDVVITLKNSQYAETAQVTLAAGQTSAMATVPESWLQEKATLSVVFEAGEGYQAKKDAKHKLQVYPLPGAKMEKSPFFGFLGKSMKFNVTLTQTGNITKDRNVFQLRNQNGLVLSEKAWKSGKTLTFSFDVTADMLGKNLVDVYLDGVRISDNPGYIAIGDTEKPVVKTVDTKAPYMAVTLDCGFAGRQTDDVLAVLEKHNITCTFFMTGYFLRTFPDCVQKIAAAGHEIGNHTNTHPHLTQIGTYDMMRQIQRPTEDIAEMLGRKTTLMRPPYGDVNKYVTALTRAEGQEVIMWTIDSHDWDTAYDQSKVEKRVKKDVGPGTIILFHLDGYYTPEVLDQVLPYYMNELGLQPVTVTQLLSMEGQGPDARLPEEAE